MANVIQPAFKSALLRGLYDLTADYIRVMLVSSAYVYSAAHEFLSDITAGNDNGRSAALAGKTVSAAGVFDANDTSLTATAAVACNAVVVFAHTGADATARIIAYIDTPALGLPFTPAAGQNVPITWTTARRNLRPVTGTRSRAPMAIYSLAQRTTVTTIAAASHAFLSPATNEAALMEWATSTAPRRRASSASAAPRTRRR